MKALTNTSHFRPLEQSLVQPPQKAKTTLIFTLSNIPSLDKGMDCFGVVSGTSFYSNHKKLGHRATDATNIVEQRKSSQERGEYLDYSNYR